MADPPAKLTMYPTSIKPTPHKKRKKHRESFCQRLARNLDRFDHQPELWSNGTYTTPSPNILLLPAELRQNVLLYAIADGDMYEPRPNSETQRLSLVCQVFARDVVKTKREWDKREVELRRRYGTEREGLRAYVEELMGPVNVAAAALTKRTKLVTKKKRPGKSIAEKRMKKTHAQVGFPKSEGGESRALSKNEARKQKRKAELEKRKKGIASQRRKGVLGVVTQL